MLTLFNVRSADHPIMGRGKSAKFISPIKSGGQRALSYY